MAALTHVLFDFFGTLVAYSESRVEQGFPRSYQILVTAGTHVDCAGFLKTRIGSPPADPAPFNHSTKIAVLRVRRKDGRTA